jgi:DNA-binding transcriptional regulator YdaS (Cro superfamily)
MTKPLTTFEHVIQALGGLKAVAALTGVTPAAVCHWRARTGRFPARTMERIQAELMCRGAVAARDMFDFDPPRTYDDDDKRAAKRA